MLIPPLSLSWFVRALSWFLRALARPLLAILVIAGGLPAQASAPEKRLAARIDAKKEQAIELLRRVVDLNSGTQNPPGVRAVGRIFRDELEGLGFVTEWVDGSSWERAGHLVGRHERCCGPTILLIGHLDTVFEPDSSFQNFERVGPDRARGPGVIDMKGGIVVLLTALEALREEGHLESMDLRVVLTGDEESPGAPIADSRSILVELAREADLALGFEDGDGDPSTAVVSRRGSGSWHLETRGRRAHSSLVHTEQVGAGAIYELSRALGRFEQIREPHLTLSVGLVLGGSRVELDRAATRGHAFGKPNVVPDHAIALGDLRPFSLEQRTEIQNRMQGIVAENLPGTRAELSFADSYPPMAPSPGNDRLLQLLDGASQDLGLGPVGPAAIGRLGAADISFAAPYVDGAIDGLGLMGDGGHTTQETADLRTLAIQAKRTALLLHRLSDGAF